MPSDQLSLTFASLADPTRRAILERLAAGDAMPSELAEPFSISAPAVSRHLRVLEQAGLIARGRDAQWRPCRLQAGPLKQVADWVQRFGRFWDANLDDPQVMQNKEQDGPRNEGGDSSQSREFVATRVFEATAEAVFQAWTDPVQMARWWGPHGFTNPICEMDARTGGAWRIVMLGPDGAQHPAQGVFREIEKPQRLVMTINHSELPEQWHDLVNPDRDKSQPKPGLEAITTVTFQERGGKTTLTITLLFESTPVRDALRRLGMVEGWSQSLERLERLLAHA
jgi:uncharacterized protein YndB with AHSA1/START domain/DNA-binding transcriptional ArsR family regulator